MKNARNAVAGLVNSKTINPKMGIDTELILYEVVDPILNIKEQFNNIKKLNFKCVNYKKLGCTPCRTKALVPNVYPLF